MSRKHCTVPCSVTPLLRRLRSPLQPGGPNLGLSHTGKPCRFLSLSAAGLLLFLPLLSFLSFSPFPPFSPLLLLSISLRLLSALPNKPRVQNPWLVEDPFA